MSLFRHGFLPAFFGLLVVNAASSIAEPVKQVVQYAARPLPLSAVRVTGGPLKRAQELDAEYLLKLEPDRMMAYFRKRAGLEPKAQGYGGWDGDGKNLTGHIAGHYLSAVSLMYAATGDVRFKERADLLVRELKEVQDKHSNGYVGTPGAFRASGVVSGADIGKPSRQDVEFVPFYRLHERTYAVYQDLFTPVEWEKRAAEIAADLERQRKLEAATISFVQPGEMQPERNFNQQGENTTPERVLGRPGRRATGWFSFDMPVDPAHTMVLIVTLRSGERRRADYEVLVNGQRVGQSATAPSGPARFHDVEYTIPPAITTGKQKVTVRFQATNGTDVPTMFGIRLIRADAPR